MITYFKNQKDLADALIEIIDSYWKFQISEPTLIEYLKQVYENNPEKIISNTGITPIVSQKLGKKRLNLLIKILQLEEAGNENS